MKANHATTLLLLAEALLWLAACGALALLVFWLYISPIYENLWSSTLGAIVSGMLCVYAAVGCLSSVAAVFSRDDPPDFSDRISSQH